MTGKIIDAALAWHAARLKKQRAGQDTVPLDVSIRSLHEYAEACERLADANQGGSGVTPPTSGHTPGPWRVEVDRGTPRNVCDANDDPVALAQSRASLGKKDPEALANAKLIAEAPAMLALLRKFAAAVAAFQGVGGFDEQDVADTLLNEGDSLRALLQRIDG